MAEVLEQFPIRLRYHRVLRGWTQGELARAAGLPQSSVSFFETARRAPSVESLVRLADALGVSVDALLGREGQPLAEMTPVAREVLAAVEHTGTVDPKAVARLARVAAETEARRAHEEDARRRAQEDRLRREESEALSRLREAASRVNADPVGRELLGGLLDALAGVWAGQAADALGGTGSAPVPQTNDAGAATLDRVCRAAEALECRLRQIGPSGEAQPLVGPPRDERDAPEGWRRWALGVWAALAREPRAGDPSGPGGDEEGSGEEAVMRPTALPGATSPEVRARVPRPRSP